MRFAMLMGSVLALSLVPVASVAAEAQVPSVRAQSGFDVFVPRPTKRTRFDYGLWDRALENVVMDLGPSLRRRAQRPRAAIGSRLVAGHDSAYRLDGSRFTFAYIDDTYEAGLRDYRMELQDLGTRYDIASLPRDEQLAYWLNLHNVALLEKVSQAYPVGRPERIKVEVNGQKTRLDEAKFLTVKGVPLSLKDIRTQIVYANWPDQPNAIYGFFRGDIGSPRLDGEAFTATSVNSMLEGNAEEFVNSLRGFNEGRSERKVSRIYEEAQPYYFPSLERDLMAHMVGHARDETVRAEMSVAKPVAYDAYEDRVADLSGGNGRGASAYGKAGYSPEIERLIRELQTKQELLEAQGLINTNRNRSMTVTIEDIETDDLAPDPRYAPYANGVPEE